MNEWFGEAGADPYQVLGLASTASLDDAEDAYHLLLRRHHPDMHQNGSPAEIRTAELRTRQLNDAIREFRTGRARPAPDPAPTGAARNDSGRDGSASPPRDQGRSSYLGDSWNDLRQDPWAPPSETDCPLCGAPFHLAADLKTHASVVHHVHLEPQPRRRRRRSPGRMLGPLNRRSLIVVGPVNLMLAAIAGTLASQIDTQLGAWVFAVCLAPIAISLISSDS